MTDCSAQTEKLRAALDEADALVIGAGAGLSTSAGFTYDGERFRKYFADFEAKYGFHDMYSGGFYPYATPEEHWAYWSRYILINRYTDAPKPVYESLLRLVRIRIISSSPRTSITAFRRRALIKSGCSTHRATMGCSSAASRAAGRRGTMKRSYGRWSQSRRT